MQRSRQHTGASHVVAVVERGVQVSVETAYRPLRLHRPRLPGGQLHARDHLLFPLGERQPNHRQVASPTPANVLENANAPVAVVAVPFSHIRKAHPVVAFAGPNVDKHAVAENVVALSLTHVLGPVHVRSGGVVPGPAQRGEATLVQNETNRVVLVVALPNVGRSPADGS